VQRAAQLVLVVERSLSRYARRSEPR
jgi:hypothetical protein